jgi:putative membrane protein
MKRPILVLCIDRDNDLYEKAKVSGPLVGRERNLQGAQALSLADPEDPDSNAIYYAVKTFDKMRSEGHTVEVVTLTGHKSLGYKADKEISDQLDKIVRELNPTSCVLVSDGAADEEILPVIKSRLKVDSSKIVFIKQAKELEKTYFVLLEKLRDPYFAKIVIGIPAVLILLLSISSYFGIGWQPVGVIIGVVLLLRLFGVDDMIGGIISDFRFSFERTSWVGYVGALAIFSVALFVGYQSVLKGIRLELSSDKLIAYVIGSVIWIVFVGLMLIMAGKTIDALIDKKKYRTTKYMLYSTAACLTTVVMLVGSSWIVNISEPYVDFGMFLLTIALSLVLGYFATSFVNWYRKEILLEMKIEGKEAISEHGTYLGKVVGLDARRGRLVIQTIFEKRYTMPVSAVSSVDENVVLKTTE